MDCDDKIDLARPHPEASIYQSIPTTSLVRLRAISGFRVSHIGSHIVAFYTVKGAGITLWGR